MRTIVSLVIIIIGSHILTLARWPYTLTEDKVAAWESCADLSDFEQTLHDMQAQDVYYAKPSLLQKSGTGEIGAFYALTEECESVFPVRADGFLNLSELKVKERSLCVFSHKTVRRAQIYKCLIAD